MTAMLNDTPQWSIAPLRLKLKFLGITAETELKAILSRIKRAGRIGRNEDIIAFGSSPKHTTVLIDGIACMYERLLCGARHIYAFQYPGDFCDLSLHALQVTTSEVAVAAVADCSIGIIENSVLDQLVGQYPILGLALLRSSVLDAGALRARLVAARQTALHSVSHLLCEQLVRLDAIGVNNGIIPVSQIDLADAAGLSTVHVNRTFKEMQAMGLLAKVGRSMKVVDREGLARLADFDGSYLNMPKLLARWDVKISAPWMRYGTQADSLPLPQAGP
jgi:CRP-like cAMP-binding protein